MYEVVYLNIICCCYHFFYGLVLLHHILLYSFQIWDTPGCYTPLLNCHNYIFTSEQSKRKRLDQSISSLQNSSQVTIDPLLNNINKPTEIGETVSSELQFSSDCHKQQIFLAHEFDDLAKGWAMCLVNLVMGNAAAVTTMCKRLGAVGIMYVIFYCS